MVNFGDAPDGGQILRSALQHELELDKRIVQLIDLDQRPSKRDARDR